MSEAALCGGDCSLSVHELLRRYAPASLQRFGTRVPWRQRQVLKKILSCRTNALGGQLYKCSDCGCFDYRYHSCNDRHCPQCGQPDAEQWLAQQKQRLLLPVPYFLITFTVPEELRLVVRAHLEAMLNLLFATTSRALQDLAANPDKLGAQLGMLGVLHTWTRTLIFHPHIHYLIPGGGLSLDQRTWVAAKPNYLLSHEALGLRARTLFKQQLEKKHPLIFKRVPPSVWETSWNVGAQAAGSGENALRYLSRYVFKTATANRKIKVLANGKLLWTYRESNTRHFKEIELEPDDFIGRFLQHILPPHFARARLFGWLHPAAKARANRVRALLKLQPILTQAENQAWNVPTESSSETDGQKPIAKSCAPACPRCQKPMQLHGIWHAGQTMLQARPPP